MLALPRFTGSWQSNLEATPSATDTGTIVTGSGTANTKGSYSPLIDPVTFDAYMIGLYIADTAVATTDTDTLLDLAIGPSGGGSEQIIVPDLLAGWRQAGTNRVGALEMYLPIHVPKGLRLSARCQSVQTSKAVDVTVVLFEGPSNLGFPVFTGCDAYGITSSGASSGTSHTPGNTGAESSYASIGSTTSKAYKGVLLLTHPTNTATTNVAYHFELGIGSATPPGAEWYVLNTTSEESVIFPSFPYLIDIPSGTQLQVRAECSGTAQAQDVALYCFY